MAFPQTIDTFPTMQDLTAADMANVKLYQQAMQNGDFTLAAQYLAQITNADKKLVNAAFINTITSALTALENYSQNYVVSATQPTNQVAGDYWFEVIS